MDTTNRSNLALGGPDMCFVLSFVNDGFCLGSTSMEHDFVNYDSKFNFFPPSKKKKGHFDWTLKKYSSIRKLHWDWFLLYCFHSISLSFDNFCHSLLPLSLSLSKLSGSSLVGLFGSRWMWYQPTLPKYLFCVNWFMFF